MDEPPISYLLFKVSMEMNYQDTFEKDHIIKHKYNQYLQGIEGSKKKGGEIIPASKSLQVKL